MTFALPFPAIDPVALQLGPLAIRWYALAYVVGAVLGWRYCRRLAALQPGPPTPQQIDDFLTWAMIGVILGGRLGYVLFYQFDHYLANPGDILRVWQGGMSFHGGMLGVTLALILYARNHKIPLFALSDLLAATVPIGLFLGRLANFINGELYGRPTDVSWAVVFPDGGPLPRHPSQLYEAAMEGLILFLLLWFLYRHRGWYRFPGRITGLFLIGYGISRIVAELFREPDSQLGYFLGGTTMGQWLSLPMVLAGLALIILAARQRS